MAKLFRTFALVLAALLALSSVVMIGCGGDDEEDVEAAAFTSASPESGSSIAANSSISVTFDNDPGDVTSSVGTVSDAGRTRTIAPPDGGFAVGTLDITLEWTNGDGSQSLNYTVTPPDTEAPTVTGGTVEDGDEDVDPEALNTDGIEITFSEDVTGTLIIQPEEGENIGWRSSFEGSTGTLTPIAGRELGNETTYVITGPVSDAAGNELEVSVTFTTKAKE